MTLLVKKCKEGIQFAATIQPRSSKNCIVGLHNDTLKIRLTSPPVEGAANQLCVKFLADFLEISPSRVSIIRGLTGRNKTIRIDAMDEATFLKKVLSEIHENKKGV